MTTDQNVALKGTPLVMVQDLTVETSDGDAILEEVSFAIGRGEVLGLVGESGSGKTTSALALLGYTQTGARIKSGSVTINGEKVPLNRERGARQVRGRLCSYVPQNPGGALNPSMRISTAISAMIEEHRKGSSRPQAVASALANVGLPDTEDFRRRYPHQLSGGQQQRVCISIALSCEPPLIVLDEPTTGLDVVTQAHIINELLRLRREHDISMLYVAHDLAVVAQIATKIAVMYAGRIIEHGSAQQVLSHPRHPYTRGLLASIPDHLEPRILEPMPGVAVGIGERPKGCAFANRCSLRIDACQDAVPDLRLLAGGLEVRCIRAEEVQVEQAPSRPLTRSVDAQAEPLLTVSHLRAEHRSRHEVVVAADEISFELARGKCVALVGESGSGKTTIARAVVGLHPPAAGQIALDGVTLPARVQSRSAEQRRRIQMVFQNPADALNPRHTTRQAVARSLTVLGGVGRRDADAEVDRLLEVVRLPRRVAERYPRELSGGERQRVGIARAIAPRPDVIVCDEVTSALDVSVQAAVLELLANLRRELGLTLLFITHDLGVVSTIADHVLVLDRGIVTEVGPVAQILNRPEAPYTQRLLEAAPSVSHALAEWALIEAGSGQLGPDARPSQSPVAPGQTS